MYQVTLSDGTIFEAMSDGAGNMICNKRLEKAIFSPANLSHIIIVENGAESIYENQALRTFYYQADGSTFIRFGDKTEMEKQAETIQMLTDCLLEMSEIIYA